MGSFSAFLGKTAPQRICFVLKGKNNVFSGSQSFKLMRFKLNLLFAGLQILFQFFQLNAP